MLQMVSYVVERSGSSSVCCVVGDPEIIFVRGWREQEWLEM